jgi:hypothetical protein
MGDEAQKGGKVKVRKAYRTGIKPSKRIEF